MTRRKADQFGRTVDNVRRRIVAHANQSIATDRTEQHSLLGGL